MTQVCQKKVFGLRQINSKSEPVPSVRRGQDQCVTPGMLGTIERGVGFQQHAGDVLGDGAGAAVNTGAEAQGDGLFVDLRRVLGQGLAELIDQLQRAAGVGAGQNQQKLLTTITADAVVTPQTLLKMVRAVPEHVIADQVAVAVVDLLEVIQIEHGDGQRCVLAAGTLQLVGELFKYRQAIGQPGERVAQGGLAQLRFDALTRQQHQAEGEHDDGPRCQDSCRLIGFTQTEPRGRKEPCNAALLC